MTRMRLYYIDKDGTLYTSIEFNGDGYCTSEESNGWKGIKYLLKFNPNDDNFESIGDAFTDMVMKFNEENYGYEDDEVSYIWKTENIKPEVLIDKIDNSCTDYTYIRNDGEPIYTSKGVINKGITVFDFDEIYTDEYIQKCIGENVNGNESF